VMKALVQVPKKEVEKKTARARARRRKPAKHVG
jgi:hypothetical protein